MTSTDAVHFSESGGESEQRLRGSARRSPVIVRNFWGGIGLPDFQIMPGEPTPYETVCRIAHRWLGIFIKRSRLVHSTVSGGALVRSYFFTSDWEGCLRSDVNPAEVSNDRDTQGVYEWVMPGYLGCYVHHPEVKRALNCAHQKGVLLE